MANWWRYAGSCYELVASAVVVVVDVAVAVAVAEIAG